MIHNRNNRHPGRGGGGDRAGNASDGLLGSRRPHDSGTLGDRSSVLPKALFARPLSDQPTPRALRDEEELIWDEDDQAAVNYRKLGQRLAAAGDLFRRAGYGNGLVLVLPRRKRGRDAIILADLQPIASVMSWTKQRRMWDHLVAARMRTPA